MLSKVGVFVDGAGRPVLSGWVCASGAGSRLGCGCGVGCIVGVVGAIGTGGAGVLTGVRDGFFRGGGGFFGCGSCLLGDGGMSSGGGGKFSGVGGGRGIGKCTLIRGKGAGWSYGTWLSAQKSSVWTAIDMKKNH